MTQTWAPNVAKASQKSPNSPFCSSRGLASCYIASQQIDLQYPANIPRILSYLLNFLASTKASTLMIIKAPLPAPSTRTCPLFLPQPPGLPLVACPTSGPPQLMKQSLLRRQARIGLDSCYMDNQPLDFHQMILIKTFRAQEEVSRAEVGSPTTESAWIGQKNWALHTLHRIT